MKESITLDLVLIFVFQNEIRCLSQFEKSVFFSISDGNSGRNET